MGHFDNSASQVQTGPIPDRLARLDNELESGAKDFDFVFAVRKNHFGEDFRFRVAITFVGRHVQHEHGFTYMATAVVAGKKHRAYGDRPSHTVIKMLEQLRWATGRMTYDANLATAKAVSNGGI